MFKEFEKRLITSFILIPISIFFIVKGSIFFIFFLSILFLVACYEWILMIKKNDLLKLLGIIFLIRKFIASSSSKVCPPLATMTGSKIMGISFKYLFIHFSIASILSTFDNIPILINLIFRSLWLIITPGMIQFRI